MGSADGHESAASLSARVRWVTLAAMTLSASMILVDQTSIPLAIPHIVNGLDSNPDLAQWVLTANVLLLAALMVFGGRLGDLIGLRKVFLAGAVLFVVSSALAGAAQDMAWLIAVRATQGAGAALMMPTSIAIVSNVFGESQRGRALGLMAGISAFAAAAGPVVGGTLTELIDWRAVFYVNVPLAIAAILLTLSATPALGPGSGHRHPIDYPGTVAFGIGMAGIVLGLGHGQSDGWGEPLTLAPLVLGVIALAAFFVIERRTKYPLVEFKLLRRLNFLAANLSQMLAGAVELGLGFLIPSFLLLIIGFDPLVAGLALIPSTVPVILFGPLAGRLFDRVGGRIPLVAGFLILALAGVALAIAAGERTYGALVPGLVLYGIGLGVVLTVNDPTGLNSVPEDDQGEAAGIINTSEQLGGALGIVALSAVAFSYYHAKLADILEARGIDPSQKQVDDMKEYINQAQQTGLDQSKIPNRFVELLDPAGDAFTDAFELVFLVVAGIALAGAVMALLFVRREDRVSTAPVFSRRSRWVAVTSGRSPAITRREPPEAH
jgi:EmrB/QacA subfamily drug resistance transporter